ncbi:MAG: NADPH-dependent F420 reductase [Bacteroidota bacterium]
MTIGLLGAGNIGATLARLLTRQGHDVVVANSRGPETLHGLVAEIGPRARADTAEGAAWAADLAIEAVPFKAIPDLPADALAGTILVSASNYYPGRDGQIDLGGATHTEWTARHVPDARVVKAFNTIYWEHLRDQGDPSKAMDDRRVIPLAGDDPEAKQAVAEIVEALGFAPLDLGTLAESGRQEPGQPIYNADLTLAEARALVSQ